MNKHEGRPITDVVADAVDALVAIRRWCEQQVVLRGKDPQFSGSIADAFRDTTSYALSLAHERQRSATLEAAANARIALLEAHLSAHKQKTEELRKENECLRTQARSVGRELSDLGSIRRDRDMAVVERNAAVARVNQMRAILGVRE